MWPHERSRRKEDSREVGVEEIMGKGEIEEEAGKKKKRTYDYRRYSVRVVVVSDTRHVAYYHRYAARGPRQTVR